MRFWPKKYMPIYKMAKFADKNECAIHIEGDHCTPIDVLQKMAKVKKIQVDDVDGSPISLLSKLKEKTDCASELCVVEKFKTSHVISNDIISKILKYNFKIKGPKYDVEKWLSNNDTDKTMKQWQIKFKDFYHIPFQMRDFKKSQTELSHIDFKKHIDGGFKCFGCVPNTDWSSGDGEHWFALFFDFRKEPYTLEYFNSSGENPLPEFNDWLNETEQKLQNAIGAEVKKIIVTRIQNQYDNSSCGCYSLYYIYSRLHGVEWIWFRNNRVTDELMYKFREFLFNDEKARY